MTEEVNATTQAAPDQGVAVGNGHSPHRPAATSEEMLSFLVHELRNPLAVVKGFAETIESSAERLDRQALINNARSMKKAAAHLEELVESLGDIRSLFGDEMRLSRQETLMSELIHSTVADLAVVTGDRPVVVQIGDDARLAVDPVRIRQVLTNLISNAYKFGPPDRPIELSMEQDDKAVKICVVDYGPGVPAGREEEVFRKFARLDTDVTGTGVGLYISRAIARAHGGELSLTPPPSEGCRFVLELPLQPALNVVRLDQA